MHISQIISNLKYSTFKLYNLVMYNLYTKFVKFLEICKQLSEDLGTYHQSMERLQLKGYSMAQ